MLLLVQVALVADHLGASAASAFAGADEGEALGLLSLCHGDGSVDALDPAGSAPSSTVPSCVLCAGIAIAGASILAAAPALPVPPAAFVGVAPATVDEATAGRPLLRYGTGRGPPVSPVA